MMKYTFILIAACAFMFTACQEAASAEDQQTEETTANNEEASAEEEMPVATFPADSVAPDGTGFYGNRISTEGEFVAATDVTQVVADNGGSAEVRLTGEVSDACQVKGCWMTVKTGEEETMRVRFQDYGFFVPKDCAGKTAYLEGTAFYDTTSVDDLRHYAVDGGMSEEEAAKTINEPEIAVSFLATGVVLK